MVSCFAVPVVGFPNCQKKLPIVTPQPYAVLSPFLAYSELHYYGETTELAVESLPPHIQCHWKRLMQFSAKGITLTGILCRAMPISASSRFGTVTPWSEQIANSALQELSPVAKRNVSTDHLAGVCRYIHYWNSMNRVHLILSEVLKRIRVRKPEPDQSYGLLPVADSTMAVDLFKLRKLEGLDPRGVALMDIFCKDWIAMMRRQSRSGDIVYASLWTYSFMNNNSSDFYLSHAWNIVCGIVPHEILTGQRKDVNLSNPARSAIARVQIDFGIFAADFEWIPAQEELKLGVAVWNHVKQVYATAWEFAAYSEGHTRTPLEEVDEHGNSNTNYGSMHPFVYQKCYVETYDQESYGDYSDSGVPRFYWLFKTKLFPSTSRGSSDMIDVSSLQKKDGRLLRLLRDQENTYIVTSPTALLNAFKSEQIIFKGFMVINHRAEAALISLIAGIRGSFMEVETMTAWHQIYIESARGDRILSLFVSCQPASQCVARSSKVLLHLLRTETSSHSSGGLYNRRQATKTTSNLEEWTLAWAASTKDDPPFFVGLTASSNEERGQIPFFVRSVITSLAAVVRKDDGGEVSSKTRASIIFCIEPIWMAHSWDWRMLSKLLPEYPHLQLPSPANGRPPANSDAPVAGNCDTVAHFISNFIETKFYAEALRPRPSIGAHHGLMCQMLTKFFALLPIKIKRIDLDDIEPGDGTSTCVKVRTVALAPSAQAKVAKKTVFHYDMSHGVVGCIHPACIIQTMLAALATHTSCENVELLIITPSYTSERANVSLVDSKMALGLLSAAVHHWCCNHP